MRISDWSSDVCSSDLTQFFLIAVVLQKTLVSAAHMAIMSIVGTFYPSSIRASGGGWASSVAKVGAVLGPVAAGVVLSSGIPILRSFAIIAICPAILCTCLVIIGFTMKRPAPATDEAACA